MKPVPIPETAEFNRLYKETDNAYSRYAATHGISLTTLCILYSLHAEDGCTQTKLVEDWSIPMQTVNSCLKSIERSGLVRLEFADGNLKRKQILLTDLGREKAQRIITPLVIAENQAMDALGDARRQQLMELTRSHLNLLQRYLFENQ